MQNFIEIVQMTEKIWQFNAFLKMAAVCHLGFLNSNI